MPMAPQTRCAEPGCVELTDKGRCAAHKPVRAPQERRTRYRGNEWWGEGSTSRWRRLRAVQLATHPDCAQCGQPANEVDHVIPRSLGGAMYDTANHQSLCTSCHREKTAREMGETLAAGAGKPRTYRVDNRVIVVSGPPCSGKTTYIAERKQLYDVVLDLDALAAALGAPSPHVHLPHLTPFVCELRDAFFARLTRKHQAPRVWIETCDPKLADKLVGAQHVRVKATRDECMTRAVTAGRPARWVDLIDAWHVEHTSTYDT